GGEANRFRVDRVSRAAEFRGVLKSTFMPPPHLDAESRDGDAPRSCRNDKVDGDSSVLPTAFEDVPSLNENINRFRKVFDLQLSDCSCLVHKNVLFFERFRQRSVTAALDFIRAVEEKNGEVFVGVRARHNQRIFGHPRTIQHRVGHLLSYWEKFSQIGCKNAVEAESAEKISAGRTGQSPMFQR